MDLPTRTTRAFLKQAEPAAEFVPALAALEDSAPSPLPRAVLWILIALLAALGVWAVFGRLDVIAAADGRLVPRSQLKIVQPAEGGVLRELLVAEGERVAKGQVLGRMDTQAAQADAVALQAELSLRLLQLRRIDAELKGQTLMRQERDPPDLYAQVEAQREARVRAYENSLAEERAAIARSQREASAAHETREKLAGALPVLVEQEKAFERLAADGFAGKLMLRQRSRERLEAEQDLRAQEHRVESARATIEQSDRRMAQLSANYRAQLRAERIEAERERSRAAQELEKLLHRRSLAELRAPADGIVKDLATHTSGTVLAPGAVLMTLVPEGEPLLAEVWLQNQDAGFVRAGQSAKLKLTAFPFQRFGMVEGRVLRISADSSERGDGRTAPGYAYRALIELHAQELRVGEALHRLLPGMQLTAEIRLADRTVLEYLLSPLQKVAAEAGRER
jgi:HlyD family secretion protein